MDLAHARRLVTAGKRAVRMAGRRGAAQVRRDGRLSLPGVQRQRHIERQARPGAGPGQLRAAEPGGEAAGAGQHVGGHRQQRATQPRQRLRRERRAGRAGAAAASAAAHRALTAIPRAAPLPAAIAVVAVGGQEHLGHPVQGGQVHVPGHHRRDSRITDRGVGVGAGEPAVPAGRGGAPGGFGFGGAGQVAQLGQGDVHLRLGGLPGSPGHHLGRDEPSAGLLQRVMASLGGGPQILRPGRLAERFEHRGHRGRATGSQVAGEPARPGEGQIQQQPPVLKPVIISVGLTRAAALIHLLRQPGQICQFRPASRGGGQDRISVLTHVLGQPVTPAADRPRPRRRQLPLG